MLNNTQSLILAIIILIIVFWCGKCKLVCGKLFEGFNHMSSFYMDQPIKQQQSVDVSGCVSGSGCSTCPALLAANPSPYDVDPPYTPSSKPGCSGKCCEGMYDSLYPPNARV